MTELTLDQLRIFTAELRKRDPRFLRIVDAEAGTGRYELRLATTGATATSTFTFCAEHNCVQTPNFDVAARDRMAADAKPPNPYEKGLAALRASEAKASPGSSCEET